MIPEATLHVPARSLTANVAGTDGEAQRLRQVAAASTPGQSLVVRVGSRFSTTFRVGDEPPVAPRIVRHGPVILAASQAAAASATGSAAARVMRAAAQQVVERARLEILSGIPCPVLGASRIARAAITLGAAGGHKATLEQVRDSTETLAVAWLEGKNGDLSRAWIEPMMIGSAVLGAILECLGASEIAVEAEAPRQGTPDPD